MRPVHVEASRRLSTAKTKSVNDLKKDLRPNPLTPCLSKVAEDCVVSDFVKPAVLKVRDPNQYVAVPKSSTTQALIHMIHIAGPRGPTEMGNYKKCAL